MRPLVPFLPELSIQLEAGIERDTKQRLKIVFEIRGDIPHLYFPEKDATPKRRDELWKRTCFEVFLGPEEETKYWEINLSSSGDWNAYLFEKYRQGMKQEDRIIDIQIQAQISDKRFHLEAYADLSALDLNLKKLNLSATAVVETRDGKISYWAFQHSGNNPDFHLRESFIAEVWAKV